MHITSQSSRLITYFFALFAGFLYALAFSDFNDSLLTTLSPLFSLAGLGLWLYLVINTTPKHALAIGYLFGFASFGWGINWLYISLNSFGDASLFFAIFSNIAVVSYLALYWLVISYLITKFSKKKHQRLYVSPFIIALLEWVRGWFILGFPWLNIAHPWVDTPIAQFAEFGGGLLISLLVVFACVILLSSVKWSYKTIAFCTYVITTFVIGNSLSLSALNISPSNTIDVALIQGNTAVITDYTEPHMQKNISEYLQLNQTLIQSQKQVDLVVWPESAIPYFYHNFYSGLNAIYQQQRQLGSAFISGIPLYEKKTGKSYNASIFQDSEGKRSTYKKVSLVPFGEYIPFRDLFEFFKSFVQIPLSDFSPGKIQQKPFKINNISASMAMCFDMIFGNRVRLNAQNSELLINISNDSWFKQSKALAQHLNMSRMRAIENRKPIVRSTSTGLTVTVLPNGAIKKAIPAHQKGILTDTVTVNKHKTIYSRYGDKPWVIIILLSLIALITAKFGFNRKTK